MPGDTPPRDDDQGTVDDQFRALMEGLRTTIPGVMVLFAFLLTLPLQAPFGDIGGVDTTFFYVAFMSSALAAALLIAPSVHQRVRAPVTGIRRREIQHVMVAARFAIAGTVLFLIAIAASVYLVTSLVLDDLPAAIATATVAAVSGWSWFYVPLVTFRRKP